MTYSQSLTGITAGTCYTPATVKIGDADIAGNALNGLSAVRAQQGVMLRGDYVLCQNPDGSQSYYRMDAERTIPGVSLVMIPV